MQSIELTIDGREIAAAADCTVLQAAQSIGVEIPTLCHSPDMCGAAACMVCAVWDESCRAFIPACSTPCRPGQVIETESELVVDFRRSIVELLLSEHRGDCEGPCRLICPQDLDLPRFLATLARTGQAKDFVFDPEQCAACGGKCEQVCRRKGLDGAVTIRELLEHGATAAKRPKVVKQLGYVHRRGAMSAEELAALARLVIEPTPEHDHRRAAMRCLQCGCAARSDCTLRRLAETLGAKRTRFRNGQPPLIAPDCGGEMVVDRAKCVRCERCVRRGQKLVPGQGPVMAYRGQQAHIQPPVGAAYDAAFAGHEGEFIDECPTGALSFRDPLQWKDD